MQRILTSSVLIMAALLLPGSLLAQDGSPSPSPETDQSPAVQALTDAFPAEIDGLALAETLDVFPVTEEGAVDPAALPVLVETATELGVEVEDLAIGTAYTFDSLSSETGVWVIGLAMSGLDHERGAQLMIELFTTDADEEFEIVEAVVAERDTVRVSAASDPEAAFHVVAGNGFAWIVATPQQELLEEAVSKLP